MLLSISALPSLAVTRYVWASSPSSGEPFTNWATGAHDIQTAVDASAANDLVLVTNGQYATGGRAITGSATNRVAIDRAITVRAVNGATNTFIVGASDPSSYGPKSVRCAYVGSNAVLNGFTLTNGYTAGSGFDVVLGCCGGGALLETNGLLVNCVVIDCRAARHGGGTYGGAVQDSRIERCRCGISGGGAALSRVSVCDIVSCEAPSGGGLYQGTVASSTVSSNAANESGGGSWQTDASKTAFIGNGAYGAAPAGGGGACEGRLTTCKFYGNVAYAGAGALKAQLTGCTLSNNVALTQGGGAAYGSLSNCVVTCNLAAYYGGGCYAATLTLSRVEHNLCGTNAGGRTYGCGGGLVGGKAISTVISQNEAWIPGGGAIDATLVDCTIAKNRATNLCTVIGSGRGGGVAGCTVTGGLIVSNWAYCGGGASDSRITACTLNANCCNFDESDVPWGEGGGAYKSDLFDCLVTNNRAYNNGNGAGLSGGTATRCRIVDNVAVRLEPGSGYRASGGGAHRAALTNCLITRNYAMGAGGGVSQGSATHCTIVSNKAMAFGGGGGMYEGTARCSIVYYNVCDTGVGIDYYNTELISSCTLWGFPPNPQDCIMVDPGISLTDPWLRLHDDSPCIDWVTNSPATEDFSGVGRPLDGNHDGTNAWDVGAWEYVVKHADSDGDGMDDGWEVNYGLNAIADDTAFDPDGDRLNNLAEYLAGTDPTNTASVLCFRKPTAGTNGLSTFIVKWTSVSGKSYKLERSATLATNDWTTVASGISAIPPVNTVTDTVSVAGGMRAYRIRLE